MNLSIPQDSLHVGEILSAIVRRRLSANRVLISLKGRPLVAEPERDVTPGQEIPVQVLATMPRIRLRVMVARSHSSD